MEEVLRKRLLRFFLIEIDSSQGLRKTYMEVLGIEK